MSNIFTSYFESPVGPIELKTSDDAVLSVEFTNNLKTSNSELPNI